jgi:Rrf2 family protein
MISRQAKYALRALIALARASGKSLLTAEIARQQKIPKRFLEQILLLLKRQGLVQSRRGARGGYTLLKPANAITFAEVLRLIDGPMAPLPCLSVMAYARCADCTDETTCEVRRVFAGVAEATRQRLELTTIAQAIRDDTGANAPDRPAAGTKNYPVTV